MSALPFAEAAARLLDAVTPLPAEPCPLHAADGRVLAGEIRSPVALPPWDNSAMDGFAVRAEDVEGARSDAPRALRIVGERRAGGEAGAPLAAGEAVRISTGAPVPPGCTTVVRVEHTRAEGDRVLVLEDGDAGRNVRARGEDVEEGAVVLQAGTLLTSGRIALAASVGAVEVAVHRRPRVAVLATGDELVAVERFDEVRAGRAIVNSNGYGLAAGLREMGAVPVMLPLAGDDPERIHASLEEAAGCDALVTTAGVSVGEHDHLRAVLEARGATLHFWRVRMRPGAPFAFGTLPGERPIPWFGLPGNPVSTFVTFEVLARPALLRMAGRADPHRARVLAEVGEEITVAAGLTHFLRVRLEPRPGMPPLARLTGGQGSGILSSVARADALLEVPVGRERLTAGELHEVIPLRG